MKSMRDRLMPTVDEARLARQWAAIEAAGLPDAPSSRTRLRRLVLPVLVSACMVVAAVVVLNGRPFDPALASGAVVGSADEPIAMALRDGSAVALSARSELRVLQSEPERMEVELNAGAARFEVTKKPRGGHFIVRAGAVRVRVIGTRFHVERSGQAVSVRVEEGIVEVRRVGEAGAGRRLQAGEAWTGSAVEPGTREVAAVEIAAPEPPQPPDATAAAALPTGASADDGTGLPRTTETAPADSPNAGDSRSRDRARARKPPARAGEQAASDLFRAASLARRAGRMREAAAAYEALLSAHPDDARAALSAFELGRIRMDMLADGRGAVRAFEQALSAGASGGMREDALARLALAHGKLGDVPGCKKARKRYLTRYPKGVHAAAVQAACE